MLRATLFAVLAATPLLAEHAGLRKMWTEEVDERSAQRVETQANLIEARLASQFDLWLHRTRELAADRVLEQALGEDLDPKDNSESTLRSHVRARLVDTARFTAPGAEAWLLEADGTVYETSADAVSGLASPPRLPRDASGFEDRPRLLGRSSVHGLCFVEFAAPVGRSRPPVGQRSAQVVVRVPCDVTDAWLAETARSLPGSAWVVAVDAHGSCILDTRGVLRGQKVNPPPVDTLYDWNQSQRFGVETSSILRSLAGTPELLGALDAVQIKDPIVRLRRIAGSRLDVLLVCSRDQGPADVAFADRIAFVLASMVALTTFLLVYARSRGTDSWIQPSVGLPAVAGLSFLVAAASATLYLTNLLDERRREETRSFGRFVEGSLVHELEGAIEMRRAYFSELDDRLVDARTAREEFLGIARVAAEAFPEGVLTLTLREGSKDAESISVRGPVALDFEPTAVLPPGTPSLPRPAVYLVKGMTSSARVVFDAPFRRVNGETDRLLWCIDLTKFLGQLFAPERTSGFHVSLVSSAQPATAVFPAGYAVPKEALGGQAFPFPSGEGPIHRLALSPRMDLFGAETSRMAVLVFGMFIAVAGSIGVTLAVGTLGSYRRASRIDPLTGVRNRMDFDETLAQELERSRRHGRALSLVILDLDYFKRINDQFKHAAGDDLLRTFVVDLTAMLRKTDTVFRYGGEEFAVLLPETPSYAAHAVIDRVRERFAKAPLPGLERLGIVTFSAGVATWDGEESADALVDRADAAMYEAKHGGRNRVVSALERRPRQTAPEPEEVAAERR